MMWAAQDRDHQLGYCQIHDLWLDRGQLMIDSQSVTVQRDPQNFYTLVRRVPFRSATMM